MKRYLSVLLVFFLPVSPSFAKGKKAAFDEKAALSYIKDLAADSMMGRRSGQPGATSAEEYIASRFKEWGIEPAGDDGTYFQNFTIEHSNVEQGVVLEVITEKERRNFYYGEDWRVQRLSGSGNFVAEIVFVGFGIHAPEKDYDDYAGVDVKGKLVLLLIDSPTKLEDKLDEKAKLENRIKAAQEQGAAGILGFRRPSTQRRYFRFRLEKEFYKPDFVLLTVEDKVTNFIFKDLETELRYLLQEIDKKSKPMSLETGVKTFISVKATFDEKRPTRNVLAKITGSDKTLKDEFIMIGAHMDHLGISPRGEVMNGADDNASGTAVVMEIARQMKLDRAKPKRTVIFALWAGEEQGLLGSRHYTDHPPYPIEKTITYINMDMVGQGTGNVPFRGVYYAPQIWKVLKENLPEEIAEYVKPGRGGPGGSDHTPFLEKGVPTYGIYADGYHFKYHTSRDDPDLINPEVLKKTGDFVYAAVEILASEPVNFIRPRAEETYLFKYQKLINFELSPLSRFVEHHKEAKDSHVDLQLSVLGEKEDLEGDALRMDLLRNLLDASEKIKKAKGLTLYSSSSRLNMDIRQGKTTVLIGLKGVNSFRDEPRWAQVLAKQGVYFVFMEKPSFLFGEEGLSEEGLKIVKALNANGLLLVVEGLDASQAKALLEGSKKPLVLLERDLPDKDILELIKKNKSALGLILSPGEDSSSYFKKLDEVKNAIGTDYLMIVNEQCLWGEKGKEQMLGLISEIIRSKYKRPGRDVSNLFSSTFLRVLDKARGEKAPQTFAYRPF
ncbi:MAG: M20/M25/M40 family metallo-hydrolase [Candidatus Aminicenantes bacterium]|nr:M20/M25/M40 family metallo-hydrolase [Candidatus Aminicenantes bacterium]